MPSALYRRMNTPRPLPSWPALVQTTTNASPAPGATTACDW
jgi:hypothetical protein